MDVATFSLLFRIKDTLAILLVERKNSRLSLLIWSIFLVNDNSNILSANPHQ